MAQSLPRYVRIKNRKDLVYQRRVPTKILETIKARALFQRSMYLTIAASEKEISKAIMECHELYELHCRLLSNSSIGALSDKELDVAATELLRKIKMRAGRLINSSDKATSINQALWGLDDGQIEMIKVMRQYEEDTGGARISYRGGLLAQPLSACNLLQFLIHLL